MRQALGRGLDALIPKSEKTIGSEAVVRLPLGQIRPNRLQPRKYFDPEQLSELASSIKEHGLAQPILVSYDNGSKTYELIAGERRLRATELAGLKEIEAIVRTPSSDRERLIVALIENLQRENLNPIEQAYSYSRLIKDFQISQAQLVQVVGKSKSSISNTLRLLSLPDEIQKALQFGSLTEGHARALLMIEDPVQQHKLFNLTMSQKLSVRAVEDLARTIATGKTLGVGTVSLARTQQRSADIRSMEAALQQVLGTKVEIKTKKDPSKGTLCIHFYSLSDFDKITKMLIK